MIIEYDFGKKERSTSKRFARTAPADASKSIKPFGGPGGALEIANARIAKLEAALRGALAAASGQNDAQEGKILVDGAEHARLLRCRELVAAALKPSPGAS